MEKGKDERKYRQESKRKTNRLRAKPGTAIDNNYVVPTLTGTTHGN